MRLNRLRRHRAGSGIQDPWVPAPGFSKDTSWPFFSGRARDWFPLPGPEFQPATNLRPGPPPQALVAQVCMEAVGNFDEHKEVATAAARTSAVI